MAKKGDGTFVLLPGRECAVREVLAGWAGVRAAYKVISPRTLFSLDRSPGESLANRFSFKLPLAPFPWSTSFPGSFPIPYIRTREDLGAAGAL